MLCSLKWKPLVISTQVTSLLFNFARHTLNYFRVLPSRLTPSCFQSGVAANITSCLTQSVFKDFQPTQPTTPLCSWHSTGRFFCVGVTHLCPLCTLQWLKCISVLCLLAHWDSDMCLCICLALGLQCLLLGQMLTASFTQGPQTNGEGILFRKELLTLASMVCA